METNTLSLHLPPKKLKTASKFFESKGYRPAVTIYVSDDGYDAKALAAVPPEDLLELIAYLHGELSEAKTKGPSNER